MLVTPWLDVIAPLVGLSLMFVAGILAGYDLAVTRRARRDLADAETIRAATRLPMPQLPRGVLCRHYRGTHSGDPRP